MDSSGNSGCSHFSRRAFNEAVMRPDSSSSKKGALQRALQEKRKNLDEDRKNPKRKFRFNAAAKLDNSRVKDAGDK